MARAATETNNRMRVKGPVGVALRNYLTHNNLTVREFNEKVLGLAGRNVIPYAWLAGRSLPSKQYIPVLAKALGKPLGFFEAREAPKTLRKKQAAVAAPEASQSNGVEATPRLAETPEEALEYLQEDVPSEEMVRTVVSAVVHARKPEAIMRERERATVPSVLDGSAKNSLTYWSNGDGTATVTMLYNAPRELAQKVFSVLAELGVDAIVKDEI